MKQKKAVNTFVTPHKQEIRCLTLWVSTKLIVAPNINLNP